MHPTAEKLIYYLKFIFPFIKPRFSLCFWDWQLNLVHNGTVLYTESYKFSLEGTYSVKENWS